MRFLGRRYLFVLFASFLAVLMIPLFTGSLSYFLSKKTMEEEIFRTNLAILEQAKIYIDKQLEQKDSVIAGVALDAQVNNFLTRHAPMSEDDRYHIYGMTKSLTTLKNLNPFVSDFYIYFRNTDIILTSSALFAPERFFNYVLPPNEIGYEQWREEVLISSHQNKLLHDTGNYLTYVRSLPSNLAQDTRGNLVVRIEKKAITELFAELDWLDNGSLYILDETGNIMIERNSRDPYKEYLQTPMQDKSGYSIIDTPDGHITLSYITSEKQGWKYVSVMPIAMHMERISPIKWSIFVIFAVSLLVGLLLVVVLTYHSYHPVLSILTQLIGSNKAPEGKDEFSFIQNTLQYTLAEKSHLIEVLEEQKPMIRSNLLLRILDGQARTEYRFFEFLNYVGMPMPFDSFVAAVFSHSNTPKKDEDEADVSLLSLLVQNILEEYSSQNIKAYIVETGVQQFALLLNINKEYLQENEDDKMIRYLQHYLVERLELHCVVGIGVPRQKITTVGRAYTEALHALNYGVYTDEKPIVRYGDIVKEDQSYYYPLEVEHQIALNLRAGEFEKSKNYIDYIFRENLDRRSLSSDMFTYFLSDIVGTMIKVLNEMNLKQNEVYGDDFDLFSCFEKSAGVETIRDQFYQLFFKLCDYIELQKKSHNKTLAENITEYIQKHCDNPSLGLPMIAEHFNISTAYLSRFFKEQTGENVKVFITLQRVETAKLLMENDEISIGEIARRVGYNNDVTFNRVFKKLEGIAPGLYRQKQHSSES